MSIEDEFQLLVGLLEPFQELELQQPEQVRLLQALKKLRRSSNRNHRTLVGLSADSISPSKIIRNQIRYHLRHQHLPLLHQQLYQLSILLDPSRLPKRPNPLFRMAIQILSDIDHSIQSIKSSAHSVWNDHPHHHIQEDLTVHRCLLLVSNSKSVLIELSRAIESYERFFQTLVISHHGTIDEAQQPIDYLQQFRKESIPRAIDRQLNSIQTFIHWLSLSNLAVLELEWRSMVEVIDETLNNLIQPSNSTLIIFNQPNPALIQAFIPLLKLSRLFLNKLCRRPINDLPRLTSHMSIQLIESLRMATAPIPFNLIDILNAFDTNFPAQIPPLNSSIESLIHSSKQLSSIFNTHFNSLQPNSTFTNARNWFELWITQFQLATRFLIFISQHNLTHHPTLANDPESTI